MLSHVRSAYDSCRDTGAHALSGLFHIVESNQQSESDYKRARRESRIGHRLNPFVNFRSDDVVVDKQSVDEEEPSIISKSFDAE